MRVKKQKRARRSVRFYKACCGFREPLKVLCDGNFVHAMLNARVGSLHDALPSLLGGDAKPYVTQCVIGELKKLGEAFSGTVLATRRLETAKCSHYPPLPAIDCLEAMVGTSNPEHFFVATQDADFRRKLRKVPGGALIFLQNTGLILEPPSSFQLSYARLSEAERLHMANREQKVLEDRAKQKAAQVADASIIETDSHVSEGQSEVKEVSRLKRQRAKAPNPLSQKKKQKKLAVATIQQIPGKDEHGAEGSMKATKRQRHRVRRKNPVDSQVSVQD